jgi:hypothetical protein
MDETIELMIHPTGHVRMIYSDALDGHLLGRMTIRRGSHVEPRPDGQWTADMRPVGGPVLGPFRFRSHAVQAEVRWLRQHWLVK